VTLAPVPDEEWSPRGTWLGDGKQVLAGHAWPDPPVPVAWASDGVHSQPGLDWARLAEAAEHTGLQPILLRGLDGATTRPWDDGEFSTPGDIAEIDQHDPARILAGGWGGHEPDEAELAGDGPEWWADYNSMFEPYGAQFPGLAQPIDESGDQRSMTLALGQLTPPARIGVVPAGRPADVLVRLGWDGTCNRGWTPAHVSAVLRSWEDRFGARLYEVGFAEIRLLVSRPPATLEAALPIAAEHVAFCDECGRMGLRHVNMLADTLVGNRFWDFWWD
jgi:hypothetical protein